MKILVTAAALAMLVASPALAQSYDPDVGSGNLEASPYVSHESQLTQRAPANLLHRGTARRTGSFAAYAQSPATAFPRATALGSTYHWPVYDADGRLVNGG